MRKLLPPVLFFICILTMTLLHLTFPIVQIIEAPFNWTGLLLLSAGLAISGWHNRLFHRLGTNIYTFKEPGQFVRQGLFAYTRNPMYLGFVLALLGVFVLLGSLTPLFVVGLFVLVTDRWYIPFEEKMMTDKFGDDYLDYKRSVRRWI